MRLSGNAAIDEAPQFDYSLSESGYGLSTAADTVKQKLKEVYEHFAVSVTGQKREQLLKELRKMFFDCLKENWDGYGAKPITLIAYIEAEKFINLLPSSIPLPEIVPELTGEIGFEWFKDKENGLIVSVNGNKDISYVGVFGKYGRVKGTELFEGKIPAPIIENMRRLYR
ncbi:MAG: hypothetical protein HY884_04215 [Deltaproteobacteria bacterium]|nr:hypothetical protein [Deltaproteobacteria bacterium]